MPRKSLTNVVPTVADEADRVAIRVSWSQLRSASECRQKSYWQRQKLDQSGRDVRVFFAGSVVDRVLRNWLADENRDSWSMVDAVEETIETEQQHYKDSNQGIVKWRFPSDKAKVIATCKQAARNLRPLLDEYVLPFDYEEAKWFNPKLVLPGLDGTPTEVTLVGEMDILTQNPENNQFGIWDLKITRDKNYYKKTIMQLAFYDLALFCEFGVWSSQAGLLMPLLDKPVVKFDIDEQVRREMLMRVQNYARMRWSGDIEPKKDNTGCNWCPVRHLCSKMKTQTLF